MELRRKRTARENQAYKIRQSPIITISDQESASTNQHIPGTYSKETTHSGAVTQTRSHRIARTL